MINIIRSILYALVGLAALGWISILLITVMLVGPDPDSFLTQYFSDNIIMTERLESVGQNFTDLSEGLFGLVAHMNIVLISVTTIMSLGWSAGSHYLNIDSPGKAKIYFIHWIIFTGAFVAILLGIIFYFTKTTAYNEADFIGAGGYFQISIFSSIYYFLMYYIAVILGTARFARSSVFLANKLPGNI